MNNLGIYIEKLGKILGHIEQHRTETLGLVPEDARTMVNIIFSHHESHYRAELDWVKETLSSLEKGKER